VASLPPASDRSRRAGVPQPRRPHAGDHRPYRSDPDVAEVRRALGTLSARTLAAADVRQAVDVLSLTGSALAGVTGLRRAARDDHDEAVRRALTGGLDLLDLWRATAVRPLAQALDGLDPALRDRTPALPLLLGDAPLPSLPRRLARTGPIAQARAVEVVARRLRRSLGRLARTDDPVLAHIVSRQADPRLLCGLVLTVSTGARDIALTRVTRPGQVDVPGHPASTVDDPVGPWRCAHEDAVELGADLPARPASIGLVVPSSWLGRGGWPALWARAHRTRHRPG
jgi:hypothetical protein